jgi:hypothetical protein
MVQTTLDTIDELLTGALDGVDDPKARYKIRTARQLILVVEDHTDALDEAMRTTVDDETILSTLRDLGYIR